MSQKENRLTFNGTTSETFRQNYVYDDLGQVSSLTYPNCVFAACASSPRTVNFTRSRGRLTAVPGWANAVSYHPNGLVNQVTHANFVVFTQANDPNGMARPASLASTYGASTYWSTGTYGYDGSGNIKAMGTQLPVYDSLSRLTGSGLLPGSQSQSYTYDNYGNRTGVTTNGVLVGEPTTVASNHLTGGSYDSAGNLTSWNGNLYEYDDFNMLKRSVSGAEEWLYMYSANDERYWSFKVGANPRYDRFTLRDLDGKTLREYANSSYTFGSFEDYIYRDGPLLASALSTGEQRHFDLDHLGSVRLITNSAGSPTVHRYYPYGKEQTNITEAERMKFAGHERDLGSLAGATPDQDDQDYMHARHYSPVTGRFLSVDPSQTSAHQEMPQSWNRYSYAINNPLKYTDPDGQNPLVVIAVAALYGLLSSADPANAPESVDTAMLPAGGSATALEGAAEGAGFATFLRQGLSLVGLARSGAGLASGGAQFASRELLVSHFEKHGSQVGARTVGEYLGLAQRFAGTAGGRGVQTAARANGDRLIYNAATKEFAVVSKSGNIRTYFTASLRYWETQVKRLSTTRVRRRAF